MNLTSQGESHIDVANWIYEFINLSLPMQKACEFEKMDGPHCNKNAMDVLKKMESRPDEKDGKTKKNKAIENPIWKGLDKFKGLE